MFDKLLNSLTSEKPAEADLRLAEAALLVRVAKADGLYVFEEIREIDAILARRFNLGPVEATRLRDAAQKMEATAPDTSAFAAALKSAIPFAERSAIVVAMWDVIRADGLVKPSEAGAFHDVARVLGIDPADLEGDA